MALGKSLNNILEDYFGEDVINFNNNTIITSNASGSKVLEVKDKKIKGESIEKISFIENVSLEEIIIGPYQTRTDFDETALNSLANSIKENGLIQPILVHKTTDDKGFIKYTLLAGERRFRATKLLGLKTIEAKIIQSEDLSEEKKVFLTAYENLLREDLNPLELAKTYKLLIEKNNLDIASLGKNIGKSQQYVKNYLNILNLSPKVQVMLEKKELSEGQARHLYGLEEEEQLKMASKIVNEGLTVRILETGKKLVKKQGIEKPSEISYKKEDLNENDEMLDHPIFYGLKDIMNKLPNCDAKFKGSLKNGKLTITWKK
jgi:ParB family transcriptional regulator, chromosome partitioning protein